MIEAFEKNFVLIVQTISWNWRKFLVMFDKSKVNNLLLSKTARDLPCQNRWKLCDDHKW